jgi:hypothetical protein
MFHYDFGISGATYDLAGTHGPSIISGDTGNPKVRGVGSVAWDQRPFNLTVSVNYVGRFNLTDPTNGEPDCETAVNFGGVYGGRFPNGNPSISQALLNKYCEVSSFTSIDLYSAYRRVSRITRPCMTLAPLAGSSTSVPPTRCNCHLINGSVDDRPLPGRFFCVSLPRWLTTWAARPWRCRRRSSPCWPSWMRLACDACEEWEPGSVPRKPAARSGAARVSWPWASSSWNRRRRQAPKQPPRARARPPEAISRPPLGGQPLCEGGTWSQCTPRVPASLWLCNSSAASVLSSLGDSRSACQPSDWSPQAHPRWGQNSVAKQPQRVPFRPTVHYHACP